MMDVSRPPEYARTTFFTSPEGPTPRETTFERRAGLTTARRGAFVLSVFAETVVAAVRATAQACIARGG